MEINGDEVMGFDVTKLFKDEVQMAEEDLLAMEFALEEMYEEKLAENILYFNDSPEQLKEANDDVINEMLELEREFVEKDEFEKCSVVKKVRELMLTKIDEANNSTNKKDI